MDADTKLNRRNFNASNRGLRGVFVQAEAVQFPPFRADLYSVRTLFEKAKHQLRNRPPSVREEMASKASTEIAHAVMRLECEGYEPTGLKIGVWWWAALILRLPEIEYRHVDAHYEGGTVCQRYQGLPVELVPGYGAIVQ